MTHKFKAGDIVAINSSFVGSAEVGAPAMVNGYEWGNNDTEWLDIKFDRTDERCGSQMDGHYHERSFDLVREGFFIVIDEEDNVTAEWRSLDDAERDARLSAEQASVGFTVYQRIVAFGVKTEVVETRG